MTYDKILLSDPNRIWDSLNYGGLRKSQSEVTGWRRSYYHPHHRTADAKRVSARIERALELYGTRPLHNPGLIAPDSTCFRRAYKCAYTNPASPLFLHPIFMRHLAPIAAKHALRKVTILDMNWVTSVGRFEFDRDEIRDRVRQAFGLCHGVFAIEFAIKRGRRQALESWEVRFHVEGLIWGLATDRQTREVNRSFESGYTGIPSVVRREVYDLPGAVSYMIKHPYMVYSEYPGPGSSVIRTVRPQPYHLIAAVWQRFQSTDWTDMLFAVHDGKQVLKGALAKFK